MSALGRKNKKNLLIRKLTLAELLKLIGLTNIKARSFIKASIETKKEILQHPLILPKIGYALTNLLKEDENFFDVMNILNLIYGNGKEDYEDSYIIKLLHRLAMFLLVEPELIANKKRFILTPYGYYILSILKNKKKIETINTIYLPPGKISISGNNLFEREEIVTYHKFMYHYLSKYSYSSKIILILPCSLKKPYPTSFMRKKIYAMLQKIYHSNGSQIEIITMSEPLIFVPRYFEIYYPAANYDLPPEKLTESDIAIYKIHLKKMLNIIMGSAPKRIIYTLPRIHKRIFEGILDDPFLPSGIEIQYIPYNVYYLPKLKKALEASKI
ncbi:MAG: DUF5591 domain-containing protein [Candidatus Njordarchaeia archaeon]